MVVAFIWIFGGALLLGLLCLNFVGLVILAEEEGWLTTTAATLVSILAWSLFAAWVTTWSVWSDDGVHQWDGGSGPATVCTYETDHRIVGKMPVDVTVTVCRDAR